MPKMESSHDYPENIKEEFKNWIKKYYKELKSKNQLLKSRLIAYQQRNNTLKVNIEKHTNEAFIASPIAMDIMPREAQSIIENTVQKLKTKSEQLQKCNETINEKVKQESRKIRKSFHELMLKDDITLKPYHEVEATIKDLNQKTESLIQRQNEEKELLINNLQKYQQDIIEIKKVISELELIEKEIRFQIRNANNSIAEKLETLNLQSIEEAAEKYFKSKNLLNDNENSES